ncbi:hypothetical protein [Actinomadura montaniterrae]|uniref:hypothetical protein n=1 Tax=Actinomadura montaniterrae TaxID=1803903 RepID=UPI00178C7A8A|nr:hypothetical protein [Actinomadura montaniterrae]
MTDIFGEIVRCTCGLLGCTAAAGVISFSAAPADAASGPQPDPRRSAPVPCRNVLDRDWYTAQLCREAWLAMFDGSRRRAAGPGDAARRRGPFEKGPRSGRRRPAPPKAIDHPSPRPALQAPDGVPQAPVPTPVPTVTAGGEDTSQAPVRLREQADDEPQIRPVQPVLLLGLLLPAAAAICYPFRHRILAAATAGMPVLSASTGGPDSRPVPFTYRPSLDPFAVPALALAGSGAADSARVLALSALDEHGDSSLVVLPRPDAGRLFGLAEDELLDENAAGLFIPGNLDAALAYLETELAIRRNAGTPAARRLLLVADCAEEAGRITALLDRHPGGLSAVLLGPWPGVQAVVDDDGLVDAPATLAAHLPQRLPAMSRTEARDRLHAAIARQAKDRRRPPGRRYNSRRT